MNQLLIYIEQLLFNNIPMLWGMRRKYECGLPQGCKLGIVPQCRSKLLRMIFCHVFVEKATRKM